MANTNEPRMSREQMNNIFQEREALAKAIHEVCEAKLKEALGDTVLNERQYRLALHALTRLFGLTALTTVEDSDFKSITVSPGHAKGEVRIQAEVGRKNDDNTMASVFCRYRAQFWVTPRGGIHTVGAFRKGLNSRILRGKLALRYIGSFKQY